MAAASVACETGIQSSARWPRTNPSKFGGATPTIVNSRPFTLRVRPIVSGAAPKVRRQSAWESIATGAALASSSRPEKPGPADGLIPRTSK